MIYKLTHLLRDEKLAGSLADARRIICGHGVKLNGTLINDMQSEVEVNSGDVLEYGRKKIKIRENVCDEN